MKILIRQFLGKNHSWSVCGWGIANSLISKNHNVDLFSTDGVDNLPKNLQPYVIGYTKENEPKKVFGKLPDKDYDCQISYTAMKNFPVYLDGKKNRFGIWCYEWAGKNVLPNGFAKHYKDCDKILAPSNFAKQVFVDSGVPADHIVVIPHGIDVQKYKEKDKIVLSNKKYKILVNIAQNHIRKNIGKLLEAYGQAFTSKDDVCLILKGKDKKVESQFEVSLKDQLDVFYRKYPKHGEIKIYSTFIEDISILYRSVDAVFSFSNCEGFFFPGLEAIASGKLVIAPNWGGQVDFLNENNALLISGKETRANPKSMYWESKSNATWFEPDINDAVDKLRYSYDNFESINSKIDVDKIHNEYSWDTVTDKIISICEK